ncbi:MAG: zf-HC2 domain-containing protein [Acidobacteria bacterium]|nr:zf-HC2 domain-containing protein [Acidobacteriota bacterium]
MRCVDCLPLIEEYFDGEVTGQTQEQMGAHLAACADCSAALDALAFEQEAYARYDRGGLEVTPDLWARVSAEIARTPPSKRPAAPRPFLSRAREYFAAALGLFAARPALATSLALLIVSAAVGTLWLSRGTRPAPSNPQVAQGTPAPSANSNTNAVVTEAVGPDDNPKRLNPLIANGGDAVLPAEEQRANPRAAEVAMYESSAPRRPEVSVEELLAPTPTPRAAPGVVVIEPDRHVDDTPAILVNASAPSGDVIASNARPLDPDEKDVARHVERAQMLLRSIKNARAGDAASDISYEKNLSRKLLAENATLQLEAEVKGDRETKQVLDRIEPFLLEIANMGEKPSREEVRSIQERVQKNEIVAALEVY